MIRLLITIRLINSLIVSGIGVIPIAEAYIKTKRNLLYIASGLLLIMLGAFGIYGAVALKSLIY